MGREPLTPNYIPYDQAYRLAADLLPTRLGQKSLEESLDVVAQMTLPDHTLVTYLCILANCFPEVTEDANGSLSWRQDTYVMNPRVVIWEESSPLPSVKWIVRRMRSKFRDSLDSLQHSKPERSKLATMAKQNITTIR